ncbi:MULTISPECIES: phosphonate metabolism protein/1,5-bisphosphokinase (PRPP-forming) PhnN [unclassified Shinella]|uniref:phosphonate metabolism protein/1,5-bisphosphokinase (PRPP-forming) PhnN n=1 Tax=unclassified Shinella TaxID=2643062 RepID=UPI00225D87E6|nr:MULTISPECIES: phosphonate metabolism protein/1,5-bisphosphokinase (PRPP-forming) PhnN [unclassified Shinella]MCO5138097.1 phosphonate metabolism protein/1,5-bisphosphokinase (PRPP-forming) PhnN [Shinella sp.]MDC7258214.1 phosphonate metabolism protein/1,5-bisphosphokinase (PRPP-forming) PhnN [Shinella sp. YE25]CAI0335774.1 Ribose 1,5-bisphosphate phosphokinase PhnN [Rhizobiaceae bacterium]CAK7260077.1 Ribose 1,5-bisphosphate phosphokinase PhnN [Shinella sp. WSC3-e]
MEAEIVSARPLPVAAGTMVVVVGPSGAGKDSVMSYAARHFAGEPRLGFVRRVITRPPDAGGEAHEAVDAAGFQARAAAGAFAVSWDAHGLSYGIPRETLDQLSEGMTLVANGSRSALPAFAAAYGRLKIVQITARADILAARLAARGRESAEAIARRLDRAVPEIAAADTVVIDNSGALEEAGDAFVRLLASALARND